MVCGCGLAVAVVLTGGGVGGGFQCLVGIKKSCFCKSGDWQVAVVGVPGLSTPNFSPKCAWSWSRCIAVSIPREKRYGYIVPCTYLVSFVSLAQDV